jgi:arylsulfatase A-like enzyme
MSFQRKAIALSIDGLGARSLGAYGNSWFKTAHFDRLAAAGLVIEQVLATKPDEIASLGGALEHLLDRPELEWLLLTDNREVCAELQERVANATLLAPQCNSSPAADWTESEVARFFSAALEAAEELQPGQLLLLHTDALTRCWDAPLAFREALGDEEDPPPPESTSPPAVRLQDDFDPDELLGWQQIYGAQVQVFDECLGILLDWLEDQPPAERPLLLVTAPRGFPLGEHRLVGYPEPQLYDELLQVPGLILLPGEGLVAVRSSEITTPEELLTLAAAFVENRLSAFERFVEQPLPELTQPILSLAPGLAAIRTGDWKLIAAGERSELFAKPDDRWEQNDVHNRCRDTVDELRAELAKLSNLSSVCREARPDTT